MTLNLVGWSSFVSIVGAQKIIAKLHNSTHWHTDTSNICFLLVLLHYHHPTHHQKITESIQFFLPSNFSRQDLCYKTIMGKISHLLFWGLGEDQQQLCGTLDLDDACHHKIIPTAHCFSHLPFHLLGCFSSSRSAFVKNTDQLIGKIIGLMMIDPKLGWLVLICIHCRSSENHSKATQFNPLAH